MLAAKDRMTLFGGANVEEMEPWFEAPTEENLLGEGEVKEEMDVEMAMRLAEERRRKEMAALRPSDLPSLIFHALKRVNGYSDFDFDSTDPPPKLYWKCVLFKEFDPLRNDEWNASAFVTKKMSSPSLDDLNLDETSTSRVINLETVIGHNILSAKTPKPHSRTVANSGPDSLLPYDDEESSEVTDNTELNICVTAADSTVELAQLPIVLMGVSAIIFFLTPPSHDVEDEGGLRYYWRTQVGNLQKLVKALNPTRLTPMLVVFSYSDWPDSLLSLLHLSRQDLKGYIISKLGLKKLVSPKLESRMISHIKVVDLADASSPSEGEVAQLERAITFLAKKASPEPRVRSIDLKDVLQWHIDRILDELRLQDRAGQGPFSSLSHSHPRPYPHPHHHPHSHSRSCSRSRSHPHPLVLSTPISNRSLSSSPP